MAYGIVSAINIAVDTIAGAVFQRLKIVFGTEGVATEVTAANPFPVTDSGLATAITASQGAALPGGKNMIGHVGGVAWETVAPAQTNQIMGGAGAAGDYLRGVLIVPLTTAAGAVTIADGTGGAITIFAGGGTSPLPSVVSFFIPWGGKSNNGGWRITTGANVLAVGFGDFT